MPRRWRRLTLAGAVAVLLVLAFVSRIALPVPGLGWVEVTHGRIVVPALGEYATRFNADALSSLLNSLFVQPNWHLLWWLAPGIALWRWRALRAAYGSVLFFPEACAVIPAGFSAFSVRALSCSRQDLQQKR